MRKLLLSTSFLCACLMAFAQAWDGSSKSAFTGEGSESKPYLIETPAQLAYLAEQVNAGNPYEGKYFLQTKELDLGSKNWTPIGTSETPFKGIYNGNDKAIYNLSTDPSSARSSLIGGIENGTLKHIRIESGHIQAQSNAAAIVYRAKSSNIEDCSNKANVTVASEFGTVYASGIASAANESKIIRCYNTGTISANYALGAAYATGIAYKATSIQDCYNTGTIIAKGSGTSVIASGICLNQQESVLNCYNASKLEGSAAYNIAKADRGVTSCYYDNELNTFKDEISNITGLSTSAMKSGEAWAGFDTEVWDFTKGAYPTLKTNGSTTSNEAIKVIEETPSVSVNGRQIVISGNIANKVFTMVNVLGSSAEANTTTGNEVTFTAPSSGIYVISAQGVKTQKIIIR